MKEKQVFIIFSFLLLLILGILAGNMFFRITVQDITGDGARGPNASYFNFTIVNNMLFAQHLSYKWELDDSKAEKPPSNEFTGSGDITIPARSSCQITTLVSPPRYFESSGEVHYFGGEGTYAYIEIYDYNICVYHTPKPIM